VRYDLDNDTYVTAFASKGGGGGAFCEDEVSPTLSAHGRNEGGQPPAIAYSLHPDAMTRSGEANTLSPDAHGYMRLRPPGLGVIEDESYTLNATAPPGVAHGQAVRRLTPTECCRLQGFPDDWLGAPNEPPDSPRYAALGDAVTVDVAEWIGRRILEAESSMTPVLASAGKEGP
jgi:site-specific DNA-cytosine methylase